MNRTSMKSAVAILAFAASNAAMGYEPEEPVRVNVRGLQSHVAEHVKKHAAEGQTRLMQYLWFNRRMHHLWLDDVMKPEPKEEVVATNETTEKRQAHFSRPTGIR